MKKKAPVTDRGSSSTWILGVPDFQLRKLLDARKLVGADAKGADTPASRSAGFVYMRPPCKGVDCPDGGGDGPPQDPCRGIPFVWQPVVAIQVGSPNGSCPEQSALDQIQQAVAGSLEPFRIANPDVRVTCEGGLISIFIWPNHVAPNSCDDLARRRAQMPGYMLKNGLFGIYIGAGLVRNLAQAAFDSMPHRLDGGGAPTPDGPIHVTSLSVDFVESDVSSTANHTVKTYITGYDERPWPDVGFTITLTDELTADPTLHAISTSNTDTNGWDEFFAVALFIPAFVLAVFPPTAFLLLNDLDALTNQPNTSNTGGVGAGILATIPTEIALPHTGGLENPIGNAGLPRFAFRRPPGPLDEQRSKLVIEYGVPIVNASGIYVSGRPTVHDRVPSVTIVGPSTLVIGPAATQTFGQFGIAATDFYGKLSVTWTSEGELTITSPNERGTLILFPRGTARPGDHFQRVIKVRVSDLDGTVAAASFIVTVIVLDTSDSMPPICKIKPWLPQCQPP
jgi:hypothetical protein